MKRIRKILHALFSRSPALPPQQDEIRETPPAPEDEDRLLALRLRKTIEEGRLFLRPGLSPEDVAAELNMEMDTVRRIFTRFIGKDFNRYLNELRIAYAAVLFMGHEAHLYSIEKIGTECGFPDNAAFGGACRMLTGMTPEVMREFAAGRKTLKGLFLDPPLYIATLLPDTLEKETQTKNL